MELNHAERIECGVAWLDAQRGPGWVHHIDIDQLKLSNCLRCVLGQLYGNYWNPVGREAGDGLLSIQQSIACGFCLSAYMDPTVDSWAELTEAWKDKITELQKARLDHL